MDFLKLNKKEYPFLFAIKAQKEMAAADLAAKDDMYFIWLGLKFGAMAENKIFEFTEEGLVDLFEVDLDAYGEACNLLGAHMGKLKKMKSGVNQAL